MIILSSTYTAPIEEVDAVRPAHLEFLKSGHAAGMFHGWGRRTPPVGGIILASGNRAEVEAFAQQDPYVLQGVATVEVIEFNPGFLADGLDVFK